MNKNNQAIIDEIRQRIISGEQVTASIGGGNLKDYPYYEETMEFKINPSYRRHLSFDIVSWVGTCAFDAEHYYPKIHLEGLSFYSLEKDGKIVARNCWDHPKQYKSLYVENKFVFFDHEYLPGFEDKFQYSWEEENAKGFFSEERAYEWLVFTLKGQFPLTKFNYIEGNIEELKPLNYTGRV